MLTMVVSKRNENYKPAEVIPFDGLSSTGLTSGPSSPLMSCGGTGPFPSAVPCAWTIGAIPFPNE